MEHEKINALIEVVGKAAIILAAIMLFALVILSFQAAHAAEVSLEWDANEPPIGGYRIYQRIEGEQYDYSKPVCDTTATNCRVLNLQPATQYYFVARAYLNDDVSGNSNEVNFKPPIAPPANFRLGVEISIYIDVNGQPIVVAGRGMTASP